MRKLLVLVAAMAAISTSAVGQDRTPPTGILDGPRYGGSSYGGPAQPGPYEEPMYTGSIPSRQHDR